jgi:hypothetical protein
VMRMRATYGVPPTEPPFPKRYASSRAKPDFSMIVQLGKNSAWIIKEDWALTRGVFKENRESAFLAEEHS